MKKAILAIAVGALTLGANAGDWGKAPVYDKTPIEECVDLGGNISAGYHTDYIYKGVRLGRDTVSTHVDYTFEGLAIPVTIGVDYFNVINGQAIGDEVATFARVALGNYAGFDLGASYTQRFYPELNNASSSGEIGLHVSRDLGLATLVANAYYNLNTPNAWNGVVGANNNDSGSFYYDLGLEKAIALGGADVVLAGGIAYADNYWGRGPNAQNGGRSSGWNHYYLRASLPIELNCRTTLTPYVSYTGAPEGWLADGLVPAGSGWGSDVFSGGISLNVSF